MERVLGRLHCGGSHEVGVKLFTRWGSPISGCNAVYTVGLTMKRVHSCLHFGGDHEAGSKLFTLWGSP